MGVSCNFTKILPKMRTSIKLKTLVSFSFMIFFFPFLQTCSDRTLEKYFFLEVVTSESSQNDSIGKSNTSYTQTEIIESDNKIDIISKSKKENTYNYYELLSGTFGNSSLSDYNKSTFEDKTFYPLFGLLLIFINSILILIFTFFNQYKLTFRFGILNFSLLILATIGLILTKIVIDINQFKIGYYLFLLNSIFIILIAKKIIKKQRNYS